MQPLRVQDYESLAHTRLPRAAWDFIAGGSGDEITLRENTAALKRLRLRPNVLTGTGTPDTTTTVLGTTLATPIAVAPVAYHTLAHPEGEIATARAAADTGALTILSTFSGHSLEATAQAANGPLWLQLYCFRDRHLTQMLVHRAQQAGYTALVLTVDTPVLGRRYRDARNAFALPPGIHPGNFTPDTHTGLRQASPGHSAIAQHTTDTLEPALAWSDIAWLRRITDLPIVLKGVLAPADAARAATEGIDAVIVSNHGGRQLDTTAATIDLLPDVAQAAGERCEVLFDGGVRDGTDALKALALGARAVLIGRPVLWSLAVGGHQAVRHLLTLLTSELADAMALCGRPTLADLDPTLLAPHPPAAALPATTRQEAP
ncbi:alpha-hydroxy acid oxidase [Streptomyces sp. NPDC053079]|uniref:alpha-hydroxy acid oxidase n=1 Tax=Streptomyces sp. NPDC053079 TaxID=3365697 RepID=UPI0037D2AADA